MSSHHHIPVEHGRSICDAPGCSHNRWHPAIAPTLRIADGDTVTIETRDSLDGQVRPGMAAGALADISLDQCHVLTGPIHVKGAAPGDLLAVHIEAVQAADRGFTAMLPGLGLLRDIHPGPFLLHWECSHGFATSPQLPNVRIPGAPFMGVMGLAPSLDRMRQVNRREADAARNGALVFPPLRSGAIPADAAIADEAWRTVAQHDVGGNLDIRQLTAGATLFLPVDVPGALFSTGDAHFAQGDGESCGTAIETSATLVARFEVIKEGARRRGQITPSYFTPDPQRQQDGSRGYYATTGYSVTADDRVIEGDATLAARNAAQAMIRALGHDYDLSPEQAYCLISIVGDLRISAIVDTPHATVSLTIPRSVFFT